MRKRYKRSQKIERHPSGYYVLTVESKHGFFEVLFDECDLPLVSSHNWQIKVYNHKSTKYCSTDIWDGQKQREKKMHRLIMGDPCDRQIDHRNVNGLDNRRDNLRIATKEQNQWNTRKKPGMTSKYKGVHWQPPGKRNSNGGWVAGIAINGRTRYIGFYQSEEEAARVYDRMAIELRGEFALINNIA